LPDPLLANHAHLLATLAAALVIGALIGSIGIGGILLSPFLIGVVGLDVRDAITISSASFVATGLAALVMFARSERPQLAEGWPLVLATLPGAFVGAIVLGYAPRRVSLAVLAVLLAATGVRVLAQRAIAAHVASPLRSPRADCAVGAFGGFVSALTGTGGPMVLVPIQLWRGVPLLAAVAIGQVAQLPIAAMATLGNAMSGGVDGIAATGIGLALVPGVFAGRRLAAAMPLEWLTRALAVLLIALGAWFALAAAGVTGSG
jgi:uncharacterized membrane protein YfcA